jgi:hypothetical protein
MYERVVKLDDTSRVISDLEKFALKLIKKRVYVYRYHINPSCDYPWEEEGSDEYREMEEAREEAEFAARQDDLAVA